MEAGFFGTDRESGEKKLEEVTAGLDEAVSHMKEVEEKPAEEVIDEIRRKHGFPVPEKDPEQDVLERKIYSAIAEYGMYSRARERKRILASISRS